MASVDTIPFKKELQYHQLADPQIRAISDGLKETEHDKFILVEGLIYRKSKDKSHFYVPNCIITNIFHEYEDVIMITM